MRKMNHATYPTCVSDADSASSGGPVVIPGNALVVDERMQFRGSMRRIHASGS